ncbi:MAG: small multi-drug export protein, partial [Cyclobacteriaceae bacterium]|nr:small multi-drug export protein [Cyclobacteriaceae bacterium]
MADVAEIIFIYFLSGLKFFAGPSLGYLAGLHILLTMFITVAGMMTSVVVFAYFGDWLWRRLILRLTRNQRKFSKRNRRSVRIWKRFGALGIAFLTPILLMPIGGTLILTSFGSPRKKIFTYMLISATFWSVLI